MGCQTCKGKNPNFDRTRQWAIDPILYKELKGGVTKVVTLLQGYIVTKWSNGVVERRAADCKSLLLEVHGAMDSR